MHEEGDTLQRGSSNFLKDARHSFGSGSKKRRANAEGPTHAPAWDSGCS